MAITLWFGSQSTILFLTLCVPAIRSDLDLGALSWLPSRALPPYVSRDKQGFSGNVLEAVRLKHSEVTAQMAICQASGTGKGKPFPPQPSKSV